MGFHPRQIGLIIVMVLNIGLCTPPVGAVLFTAQSVSGVPFEEILRDIWPFLLAQVMVVAVLVFFPRRSSGCRPCSGSRCEAVRAAARGRRRSTSRTCSPAPSRTGPSVGSG